MSNIYSGADPKQDWDTGEKNAWRHAPWRAGYSTGPKCAVKSALSNHSEKSSTGSSGITLQGGIVKGGCVNEARGVCKGSVKQNVRSPERRI